MRAVWMRLVGMVALCIAATPALAQTPGVCARLESQLALQQPVQPAVGDPTGHEATIAQLRASVEVARDRARAGGCGKRGAVLFQPPRMESCNRLDARIRAMEADLRRRMAEPDRRAPRGDGRIIRLLLAALAENDCGPQYARFAAPNAPGVSSAPPVRRFSGTYRTICVRMCDGYYWPVSFKAVQAQFGRDAQICKAACGGSEVALYVYRNPGEDIEQAVSLDGRPYTALPNALRYRQEYVKGCGCRSIAEGAAAPASAR